MSWEDDELREFEEAKRKRARNEELILARSVMRREQCPTRWIELQGKIRGQVITLNRKADRLLLEVIEGASEKLHIRREDGPEVLISFAPEMYQVAVTYPSGRGCNKTYKCAVLAINGNDTSVWLDEGNTVQPDDQIATLTLRTLLRCVP